MRNGLCLGAISLEGNVYPRTFIYEFCVRQVVAEHVEAAAACHDARLLGGEVLQDERLGLVNISSVVSRSGASPFFGM